MRRMRTEMGEGLGPGEEEMLQRMEAGEMPDETGDMDDGGEWDA